MKSIGISQRVDFIVEYGEKRDCLDQAWSSLCLELEYMPVPLPNIHHHNVERYLDKLNLSGVILSGGNSLTILDPNASDAAPERDAFETVLLDYAVKKRIPVLGVCRGMQFINMYFGGKLERVENHASVTHAIQSKNSNYELPEVVNSFHNWGIPAHLIAGELSTIAEDNDGLVEAFCSTNHRILGLMWHPERGIPFNSKDLSIIKGLFND